MIIKEEKIEFTLYKSGHSFRAVWDFLPPPSAVSFEVGDQYGKFVSVLGFM